MKTKVKDIKRFAFQNIDKEFIISYPSSSSAFAYLVENCNFYNVKKYKVRTKKKVVYINKNIEEDMVLKNKAFIKGNVLLSSTIFCFNKLIIDGFVFGKIICLDKGKLISYEK